jgi:hypothetical protein
VIVPQAAPEHPVPETLQVTAVLVVPVTAAVNCCWPPRKILADDGDTETDTGATTVTVAEADLDKSACDVAATVTVAGLGTAAGAV